MCTFPTTVVVNTYDRPDALGLVLNALADQTDRDFDVVVAEDGCSPATATVVHDWKSAFGDRIVHVSQPDEGYRQARIVNLAVNRAAGEFLLFLDGDCVPRVGMVRAVRRAALPGWFLCAKRVRLSEAFTRRVIDRRLPLWRWSALNWAAQGRGEVRRPGFFVPFRDRRRPWRPDQPDFVPPGNAYGFFLGLSRTDFERVNGWDARFVGWGNDDVDLVVRLRRIGLRCGWPGPGATLFHLWHPPGGNQADGTYIENERMLRETRSTDRVEAATGLAELTLGQETTEHTGASISSSNP